MSFSSSVTARKIVLIQDTKLVHPKPFEHGILVDRPTSPTYHCPFLTKNVHGMALVLPVRVFTQATTIHS